MQLTLKVNQGEGDYLVTTNLYVIVLWERRFKKSFTELSKDIAMEHIAYLAYEASRLAGVVIPGEFDTFLKRLTVCEFVLQDDELPTQAAIDTL